MDKILNDVKFNITKLYVISQIADSYTFMPFERQLRNIYGKAEKHEDKFTVHGILGVVRKGIGSHLSWKMANILGHFTNNIRRIVFKKIDVKDEMFNVINKIKFKNNNIIKIGEFIARELVLILISKNELISSLIKPLIYDDYDSDEDDYNVNHGLSGLFETCETLITFQPIERFELTCLIPLQIANYLSTTYIIIELLQSTFNYVSYQRRNDEINNKIINSFCELVEDIQKEKDINYMQLFESDLIIDYFPNYIPNVIFNIIKSYDLIHNKDILFKRVLKF